MPTGNPNRSRNLLIILCGLLLSAGIWILVPYNNFALNNSFISDSYLPEVVLFCMVVLVLVVNPLLAKISPSRRLSHRQLALLIGILLFAAIIPSNGLFRFLPHCLALNTQQINQSLTMAEAVRESDLPPSLFPDSIGLDQPTPVSDQLIDELDPGASIPWSAWIPPLLSWGTVIVAFWATMIGLGLIVFPQWRHNERVAFPLLKVYHAMIEDPAEGSLFPQVFKSPLFWFACVSVVIMHSFNGLDLVTGGAFPKFPLSWQFGEAFGSGIWQYAPGFLKSPRIYFIFIGLAYFMSERHSFSIWFTIFFFGLVVMATRQYMPTFNTSHLYDQGAGALIAMAGGIIWMGRHYYARTFSLMFKTGLSEEDKTRAFAARLFAGGAVVMLAWFLWAGSGPGWSVLFLVLGIMVMLLVARIVAETGITYIWIIPLTASRICDLFPRSWQTVSSAFMQGAHYILVNRASAVSATVMTILAVGLNKRSTPKSNRNLAKLGLFTLLFGLLFCGAVHLHMGYRLVSSYDNQQTPITGRGARVMSLAQVENVVVGRENTDRASQTRFVLFGIVLGAGLLFLCTRFPNWPLHPIGLIFVHSSIGLRLCVSLFLGWGLKKLIIKYFGARAYRYAMPFFLGLIVGDVMANTLWTLIPLINILLGTHPGEIESLKIFQYT